MNFLNLECSCNVPKSNITSNILTMMYCKVYFMFYAKIWCQI